MLGQCSRRVCWVLGNVHWSFRFSHIWIVCYWWVGRFRYMTQGYVSLRETIILMYFIISEVPSVFVKPLCSRYIFASLNKACNCYPYKLEQSIMNKQFFVQSPCIHLKWSGILVPIPYLLHGLPLTCFLILSCIVYLILKSAHKACNCTPRA